ncbi:alpha/beta fold hydrolase [Halomarina litorea]|uniref:alpha/beta fold hydrolase n=1 Tax=Halomarina litorea TaxID=2961595 RepID=UPI0020C2D9EE|nr:alpha/beta hydrolase [Halomarina sp. BCD28]
MDLPDGWTAGTVHLGGVELRYYRTGDGPPLVMAHGFYENGRCWERLVSDLATDYDVVTYDARGHGRSDAPASGYDVGSRIADLVGLVEALSLADPILLGHSMGGSTAAWTAATHPDLPRALVLEDPAGMYGDPELGPAERARFVRETLREWADESTVEESSTNDTADEAGWERRVAVANAECSPEIAEIAREGYPLLGDAFERITCPTLVLKADADTERRVTDLDIADALGDGRLVHVPGAGHGVFRSEYDAAFAEMRAFLRRVCVVETEEGRRGVGRRLRPPATATDRRGRRRRPDSAPRRRR